MTNTPQQESGAQPSARAPRFPALTHAAMSPRQRELAEEFMSFSLKGMRGPFVMMLRSPEAAARFQALGGYLRFETGLDDRLIELAVLIHSRLWTDQYEWLLHAPRAAKAGLSAAAIEAIRRGEMPADLTAEEQALAGYVLELVRDRIVRDATFSRALSCFGEQRLTDLTFLLGQYGAISMFLAVAEEGRGIELLPPCEQPFARYAPEPL